MAKVELNAVEFIKSKRDDDSKYYPDASIVPIKGAVPNEWLSMIADEHNKIDRMNYEVARY